MSEVSGLRVVSAVPGRLRLRALDTQARDAASGAADEISTWPEVISVDVRAHSGSVVVRFDAGQAGAIADRLRSIDVDPLAVAHPAVPRDFGGAVGAGAASANRAVARRLDGTDLRVLVPLGLGLLAARRAMAGEERLADAPWYLLAWYASETFWKFHGGGRGDVADSEGE